MKPETFDWQKLPKLEIAGDWVFPDTRAEYKPGGWWQKIDEGIYQDLNYALNLTGESKNEIFKLMGYGMIYKPANAAEGILRSMVIEDEMRRKFHGVQLFCFFSLGDDDLMILDTNFPDFVGEGWKKLMYVVNRRERVSLETQIETVNILVARCNQRLKYWSQPLIPRFPRNAY